MSGLDSFAAVVPSLGRSPYLAEALAALRRELATLGGTLVWVQQGEVPPPALAVGSEHLVSLPQPVGFAAATNAGIRAAIEWGAPQAIALVNDDLLLDPGWLVELARALGERPRAGAVQGVNLDLEDPTRADGWGLAWNRSYQAVQLGHGEPALPAERPPFEIFGVSATAALYRSAALPASGPFDETLESYYEDAALAVELRAAGWESWCVPSARARHAGQATSGRDSVARHRLVTRNRWLVAAELLGRTLDESVPVLLERDLRDFARALLTLDARRAAGIVGGWASAHAALRKRPRGATSPALDAARRLAAPSPGSRPSG